MIYVIVCSDNLIVNMVTFNSQITDIPQSQPSLQSHIVISQLQCFTGMYPISAWDNKRSQGFPKLISKWLALLISANQP